jgi:hypothetical protein
MVKIDPVSVELFFVAITLFAIGFGILATPRFRDNLVTAGVAVLSLIVGFIFMLAALLAE